jgi:phosphoribosylanthranilate isomerase
MVRVKICGITKLEDARVAVEAGADFLGFVFYPGSPRYVTPGRVREIVTQISDLRSLVPDLSLVGVFVDQAPEAVAEIMHFCRLDYAQLHGAEPPKTVAKLMDAGFGVIKAFRVRDGASLAEMRRYRAMAYLLDAYTPGQPGGTGRAFDWALAVQAKEHGRIILAGGLTPDNVARAVHQVRPWAVDVSSGVEAAPGHKDHDKVRRFIAAARQTEYAVRNVQHTKGENTPL